MFDSRCLLQITWCRNESSAEIRPHLQIQPFRGYPAGLPDGGESIWSVVDVGAESEEGVSREIERKPKQSDVQIV